MDSNTSHTPFDGLLHSLRRAAESARLPVAEQLEHLVARFQLVPRQEFTALLAELADLKAQVTTLEARIAVLDAPPPESQDSQE
ncbi:MAG: hypothetical protein R3E84_02535 [Pseudomonadales bacterium]